MQTKSTAVLTVLDFWRRGWDSNPRYVAAHLIEPTVRCRTSDFESDTFDHSDTSPYFVKTLQLVCKRLYYYTI